MNREKIRRYDLDWLRVLVFGLLILYHVGMFFVNWDWHLKNNVINYDLGWPMAFINRWRLHILFVISGMGTFYALSHRSAFQFAKERLLRLGVPLLFGMLIIVPPQVYFELLANNQFSGSYWTFLTSDLSSYFSWNHLWFLPYLLVFSLLLIPAFTYLRKSPANVMSNWFHKTLERYPLLLYLFVLPLFIIEGFLEPLFPINHSLFNDWFAFTNFLCLFFFGFLLISLGNTFWKALERIKLISLILGIAAFASLVKLWYMDDTSLKHYIEAFYFSNKFLVMDINHFWICC